MIVLIFLLGTDHEFLQNMVGTISGIFCVDLNFCTGKVLGTELFCRCSESCE